MQVDPHKLEPHPIAKVFPEMTSEEFDALLEDIKKHGQLHAIVLFEKKILEGVHRAKVCKMLGKSVFTSNFKQVSGGPGPAQLAISANINRRHLTQEQRAKAIINALKAEEDERKSKDDFLKMRKSKQPPGKAGGGKDKGLRGKAVEVANAHGISRAAVDRAIATGKPKSEKPKLDKKSQETATAVRDVLLGINAERWENLGLSRESCLGDVIKLVEKQRNPHGIRFGIDGYGFSVSKLGECEKH